MTGQIDRKTLVKFLQNGHDEVLEIVRLHLDVGDLRRWILGEPLDRLRDLLEDDTLLSIADLFPESLRIVERTLKFVYEALKIVSRLDLQLPLLVLSSESLFV